MKYLYILSDLVNMKRLHINKERNKQLYENDVDTVIKDMQRKYNTYGIRYLHSKQWFPIPYISLRDSLHDYGICAKVKDLDLLEYECYVPADGKRLHDDVLRRPN